MENKRKKVIIFKLSAVLAAFFILAIYCSIYVEKCLWYEKIVFNINENEYLELNNKIQNTKLQNLCIRDNDIFIFDINDRGYFKQSELPDAYVTIINSLRELRMSCIDKINSFVLIYDYGFLDKYYGYAFANNYSNEQVEEIIIEDQDIRFGGVFVRKLSKSWFFVTFNI